MTSRRYYSDSYTRVFTARVTETLETQGSPAVVLDRTWFYPTGGGQPHDTGHLGSVPVVEVASRDTDGAVIHRLAGPAPAKRLYQPFGGDAGAGARLRAEGYVTVAGLAPVDDAAAEARRLGCAFVLIEGRPVVVTHKGSGNG